MKDITIEKLHSGIRLSAWKGGLHVTQLYIGYTLTEAKKKFREHFKVAK